MTFLMARYTRQGPLLFEAGFKDYGLAKGIWQEPGHWQARTDCIRHFSSKFGNDTLVGTSYTIKNLDPGQAY